MNGTTIIIPARYASSRFPGKPLVPIRGCADVVKPLVQRSYDAACSVAGVDQVLIATDDGRIGHAVARFGGHYLMTPETCGNGTERVAACLDRLPDTDLLVNFQGDALLTPPSYVEALIDHMAKNPTVQVGTVAVCCTTETYLHLVEDARRGRVGGTTVVTDASNRALYFSKHVLPFIPAGVLPDETRPVLLHIGLYAYRREALRRYAEADQTTLEVLEGLEQLRFLVHGIPVSVLVMPAPDYPLIEVNNPSDVPVIEKILSARGMP